MLPGKDVGSVVDVCGANPRDIGIIDYYEYEVPVSS